VADLRGVYVVSVTPFKEDGSVDYEGIRGNVQWYLGQGVHGILPLGSTGEFASLEEDEKKRVAETVMDAVAGRVPVVVGTTAETTEKTIEYSRHAQSIGAAGVLVLPSYYCKPSQEEMYVHFKRVAGSIEIPVMIYNNPWSSGVDMQAETVARLYKDAGIRYVKECTADIKRLRNIRVMTQDQVIQFCGWEDLAYESFVMGATGWVCVMGNIAPRLCVELFETVVDRKDYEKGWEMYKVMLPMLAHLEYSGKLQQTLKYGLERLGHASGPVRSPKLPLTAEDKAKIDQMMKDMELI
jgi:4-hydroxy-tetrahydrodipicolinate synthase